MYYLGEYEYCFYAFNNIYNIYVYVKYTENPSLNSRERERDNTVQIFE